MTNEATDDDGLCCVEISVASRAYARAKMNRAIGSAFELQFETEDGRVLEVGVATSARMVELIREMRPRLVHLYALDDERQCLLALIDGTASLH